MRVEERARDWKARRREREGTAISTVEWTVIDNSDGDENESEVDELRSHSGSDYGSMAHVT